MKTDIKLIEYRDPGSGFVSCVSCEVVRENTYELDVSVDWLLLLLSSLVWLVMDICVGTFTVCLNLQNKVTQQNTDCGYLRDGS